MTMINRIFALGLALGLSFGLGACGLAGDDEVAPPTSPTTEGTTTTTTEATTTTSTTEAPTTTTSEEVAVAGDVADREELPETGASEAAVLTAAALALVLAGRTMFDVRGWLTRPQRRLAPYAYRMRYSEIVE